MFLRLGKMKRFDFVVNSFWPEAEDRLELNLSSIYAPGNPDHFFMVGNLLEIQNYWTYSVK